MYFLICLHPLIWPKTHNLPPTIWPPHTHTHNLAYTLSSGCSSVKCVYSINSRCTLQAADNCYIRACRCTIMSHHHHCDLQKPLLTAAFNGLTGNSAVPSVIFPCDYTLYFHLENNYCSYYLKSYWTMSVLRFGEISCEISACLALCSHLSVLL